MLDSLPTDLTDAQREKVVQLLRDNADIFSRTPTDNGLTDVLAHSINTGDAAPVKQSLRRHPQAYLPIIDEFVDDLLKRDLIEPCHSSWASNVVVVKKADSCLRMCLDLRFCNQRTVKDAYALPRIDTCLESLGTAKYFCVLDSNSAYYQVKLADEASKDRTAFVTRRGLFRFKVMCFGLSNAPATYSRLMDLIMHGLTYEMVLTFLDDLIVFADCFESCCTRLALVLDRIRSAKLKLKPSKCKVFQPEVRFLGSLITRDGILPDPAKIQSIVEWPRPLNLTETRAYVGICSYYRRHIRNFAEIARPLYNLMKKGQRFEWGDAQEAAFQELKQCLTTAPVLASPIDGGRFVLDTDASSHAVAAILHQEQDGVLRVISYASRVLQPTERSYCSTKLELLAAIFGLKAYRHFLLCRDFTLRTDNAALTHLLRTPEPLAQQGRWLNLISEFQFTLVHRPGVQNVACDALSRRPCERGEGCNPCTQCRPKTEIAECRGVTVHDCSDEPRLTGFSEPTACPSGGPPSYETAIKWLAADAGEVTDDERPLIDFLWPPLIPSPLPPTLPVPPRDGLPDEETTVKSVDTFAGAGVDGWRPVSDARLPLIPTSVPRVVETPRRPPNYITGLCENTNFGDFRRSRGGQHWAGTNRNEFRRCYNTRLSTPRTEFRLCGKTSNGNLERLGLAIRMVIG